MKVRIIRAANESCWYSEMIGEVFHAYHVNNSPVILFSNKLFFYPTDVELTNNPGTGILPSFYMGQS